MKMRMDVEVDEFSAAQTKVMGLHRVREEGKRWAHTSAQRSFNLTHHYLKTQGRGGVGPPLSPVTVKLYSVYGPSDGSLSKNIALKTAQSTHEAEGVVGIPPGKPADIARIQDRGANIPVTQETRSYFAGAGIRLSPKTTSLHVPGRHFWEFSQRDAREEAIRDLRQMWHRVTST